MDENIDRDIYKREVESGSITIEDLKDANYGEEVIINGRLLLEDNTGKISYFGCFRKVNGCEYIYLERIEHNGFSIPIYLSKTEDNFRIVNSFIHFGDVVGVKGKKTLNQENQEEFFLASDILILSKNIRNIYDKNIDFTKRENQYKYGYIELVREKKKIDLFKSISKVYQSIRCFLYENGYDEVNISLLQEYFEAGFATPFKTKVVAKNKDMYLKLTSELYFRKLMIAGFSKIFEISKSFRNQDATSYMHPEFTILELYKAYSWQGEMEQLVKNMLNRILLDLNSSLVITTDKGLINCSQEWPVIDFKQKVYDLSGNFYEEGKCISELLEMLDSSDIERPRNINLYSLVRAFYSHIIREIIQPSFVTNLPAIISPLNKLDESGSFIDESVLVINGMLVADIVNAERDPQVLLQRLKIQQESICSKINNHFNADIIEAMKYGLPPCRGVGIGIERLLMLLFNKKNIRDVEIFPVF